MTLRCTRFVAVLAVLSLPLMVAGCGGLTTGAAPDQRYVLRLYVTGTTPASQRAIERVRTICEEHLQGRYQLDVIDIYQLPALAKDEQIIATPTLIRVLPAPLRRFIGDLSKVEKILFGIDVRVSP